MIDLTRTYLVEDVGSHPGPDLSQFVREIALEIPWVLPWMKTRAQIWSCSLIYTYEARVGTIVQALSFWEDGSTQQIILNYLV